MFAQHQPKIAAFGRANPDNMARVLTFVLLSIHRPFKEAIEASQAFEDMEPETLDSYLWGFKTRAWSELDRNKAEIYYQLENAWDEDGNSAMDGMLAYLVTLHGFEYVKAGFVLQLLYGVSGCLDTRNRQAFNLSGRMRARGSDKVRLAKAKRYNDLVYKLGGTEFLWDQWCVGMSAQRPNYFPTPNDASAAHCIALGLEP